MKRVKNKQRINELKAEIYDLERHLSGILPDVMQLSTDDIIPRLVETSMKPPFYRFVGEGKMEYRKMGESDIVFLNADKIRKNSLEELGLIERLESLNYTVKTWLVYTEIMKDLMMKRNTLEREIAGLEHTPFVSKLIDKFAEFFGKEEPFTEDLEESV